MTSDNDEAANEDGGAMQEEGEPIGAEQAAASLANLVQQTPPGKSPPGMSLRSGRKKRRRSKETTGLTPPEVAEKKPGRKRAKKQGKDDESDQKDVEMEENESEMEEIKEVKPAAEEVAAATAAAAAAVSKPKAAKGVPPIEKLRLPSQHTPGKKTAASTAAAAAAATSDTIGAPPLAAPAAAASTSGAYSGSRRLLFGTPTSNEATPASVELENILAHPPTAATAASQPTPTGRHDALPRTLVRKASDVLVNFTSSVQEIGANLVVPQPERLHHAREEQQGEQGEQHQRSLSSRLPLDKTWTWMLLFLLVQVLFSLAIPMGINPVASVVKASSHQATAFYQGFSKQPVVKPEEVPIVEESKDEVVIEEEPEEEEEPLENPLVDLMNTLGSSMSDMHANSTAIAKDLSVAKESLRTQREKLEHLNAILSQAEESVSLVYSAVVEGQEVPDAQETRDTLDRLQAVLETRELPPLILDNTVPLWEVAPMTCGDSDGERAASPTDQDAVLSESVLQHNHEGLLEMARSSLQTLQRDPELSDSVVSWVREQVEELKEEYIDDDDDSEPDVPQTSELKVGLSPEKLQEVITNRFEVELADQTGRIDYASLRAGASVIDASPSLVDDLPLYNRIMSSLRLRFYGHGPEAALTPTFPTDALGQCWSFGPRKENDENSISSTSGAYATLTIRLAKPVKVTSVAVEHAPKELTKQVESAIRDFRVFGFVDDAAASGTPYELGSFQYNVDHDRALQHFKTATTTSSGEEIPKLQSITLAIDNNYGFDYSCLYRFRVHGDP